MKKRIIIFLTTLLSFTIVSVHADRPTGDLLGVKILEKYMRDHNTKHEGMTMKLNLFQVAQFKAGEYRAKFEDNAQLYVIKSRGIWLFDKENRSDIRCAPMKLESTEKLEGYELKVRAQRRAHGFDECS